uniref:Uncharacterized protein n=1 Tax=viral metagenome TaxID=1070528 RepID=A0A6C0LS23_9ZZZZ
MTIHIPIIIHQYKFWFWFRNIIFQCALPIILAFMTFYDLSTQHNKIIYSHLYLYTSSIIFIYSNMRMILEFIFNVCSDQIILKKAINLVETTNNLILSMNIIDSKINNTFLIIRKIFKLRYSGSSFFIFIDKLCWAIGIDSPILIPIDLINKLFEKVEINIHNEDTLMIKTLNNLYEYYPEFDNNIFTNFNTDPLLNKITNIVLEKNISDLRRSLFGLEQ